MRSVEVLVEADLNGQKLPNVYVFVYFRDCFDNSLKSVEVPLRSVLSGPKPVKSKDRLYGLHSFKLVEGAVEVR